MEKYAIVRKIGEGSYGTVYLGILKSDYPDAKRALKVYKKVHRQERDSKESGKLIRKNSSSDRRSAQTDPEYEASILRELSHPHIIKMYEYISTPFDPKDPQSTGQDILVLEYAPHGDLLSFMNSRSQRGFTERVARNLFLQILSATHYLHEFGYIHCDIKLENILLFGSTTNPVLKLTDFGFAIRYSSSQKMQYGRGSLHYASPEIILSREFYGPEADIWSLGVVLFTMVCGIFPLDFSKGSVGQAYKSLERSGLPFSQASKELSSEYKDLVMRMLNLRADRRITIAGIFESDWIAGSAIIPGHKRSLIESRERRVTIPSMNVGSPPSGSPPPSITPPSGTPPLGTPPQGQPKEKQSIFRAALKALSPRVRRSNSHPNLKGRSSEE